MKKSESFCIAIIAAILLMFSITTINLVRADSTTSNTLCFPVINLINQDPNPAIPGEYVKVLFEASGLDNPACKGMAVKLNPQYPFSLDPDYDPIQTLDGNTYISGYKTTWMIPYKIRVADDALDGDYDLKLIYHNGNNKDFESYGFIEKTFNITITDVRTDFATVIQGTSGTQVSIGIVNTGKNTANSMVVGIPRQENFMVTGISQQIIGNLAAGDYTIVNFNINSMNQRNATRGNQLFNITRARNQSFNQSSSYLGTNQMLKVQIDYTDGIGKRRNITKEIEFSSSSDGNFTLRGISGFPGQAGRSSSSKLPIWAYIIGIIVILIIGIIIYRKYGDNIKDFLKSKNHKKNSSNAPHWVSDGRAAHHKK